MKRWFSFRLRTLLVVVVGVVGCTQRRSGVNAFPFTNGKLLLGLMLAGIIAGFFGWLYYRATR